MLPVYSFWHFDDFTWGQTRKVAGEKKERHGQADGEFDSSQITMKKWEDWELERLGRRKIGSHNPHRLSLITPTTSPAPGPDSKGVIQDAFADRRMYGSASRNTLGSPISYRPSSTISVPPSPQHRPVVTVPARYPNPAAGGSPYLTPTTISPQAPIAHRLSAPNIEEVSSDMEMIIACSLFADSDIVFTSSAIPK